jgi:hypothetical protein
LRFIIVVGGVVVVSVVVVVVVVVFVVFVVVVVVLPGLTFILLAHVQEIENSDANISGESDEDGFLENFGTKSIIFDVDFDDGMLFFSFFFFLIGFHFPYFD